MEVYYCGCEHGVSNTKGALFKFSDLIRDATSISTQYLLGTKYRMGWRMEHHLCMAKVIIRRIQREGMDTAFPAAIPPIRNSAAGRIVGSSSPA